MLKMPYTGHYHSHAVFIAIFYRIVVTNRSTRLNYSSHPGLMSYFHAIGKGENASEAITAPCKSKSNERAFYGLTQSIYPRSLTDTARTKLTVFSQHDCIRFTVFYNFIGKQQIFHLSRSNSFLGNLLQLFGLFSIQIAILYQHPFSNERNWRFDALNGFCTRMIRFFFCSRTSSASAV